MRVLQETIAFDYSAAPRHARSQSRRRRREISPAAAHGSAENAPAVYARFSRVVAIGSPAE